MINVLIIDDDYENLIGGIIEKTRRFDKNIKCKHVKSVTEVLEILKKERFYDLILLDILGMDFQDPVESILRIKKIVPYLPIIMLSKEDVLESAVRCIDRGAVSYISKKDLNISPIFLSDGERKEDERNWRRIIEKIKRFSNEYQPIKRKLYDSKEIGWFTKRGRADQSSIIQDQIDYLTKMQQTKNVSDYFPRIIGSRQTTREENGEKVEFWEYDIPFYNLKSLKKTIFSKRETDEYDRNLIAKTLEKVLDVIFKKIYVLDRKEVQNPEEYLYETYIRKYQIRKEETIAFLNKSEKGEADALKKLINAKKIWIEDNERKNPEGILNELFQHKEFKQLMTPPKVSLIHGDLHFDNILVDLDFPGFITIKFIDPRGFKDSQDIAYDLGKLLHSAHGKYDFIHDGYIRANIQTYKTKDDNSVYFGKLEFRDWKDIEDLGGGSKDKTTSHIKFVARGHENLYNKLEEFICQEIQQKQYLSDDTHWKFRAYFNEAMHFCTMLPFHVEKDIIRTISIYLRGVELMNEFYDNYETSKK